jgi:hypothetical protein
MDSQRNAAGIRTGFGIRNRREDRLLSCAIPSSSHSR